MQFCSIMINCNFVADYWDTASMNTCVTNVAAAPAYWCSLPLSAIDKFLVSVTPHTVCAGCVRAYVCVRVHVRVRVHTTY